MNCDKRTYTHTILIDLLVMIIIQGVDPMIQTKLLLIIKGLKTFKKGTLS